MNLVIPIALLSGLALADKLPAGAACGTNVDCNDNCMDSRWTIADQDGAYVLVCDPNLDGTLYDSATCRTGASELTTDLTKTATACDKVGGRNCSIGCVVTQDARSPSVGRTAWKNACAELGTEGYFTTSVSISKEMAESFAGCD